MCRLHDGLKRVGGTGAGALMNRAVFIQNPIQLTITPDLGRLLEEILESGSIEMEIILSLDYQSRKDKLDFSYYMQNIINPSKTPEALYESWLKNSKC